MPQLEEGPCRLSHPHPWMNESRKDEGGLLEHDLDVFRGEDQDAGDGEDASCTFVMPAF